MIGCIVPKDLIQEIIEVTKGFGQASSNLSVECAGILYTYLPMLLILLLIHPYFCSDKD